MARTTSGTASFSSENSRGCVGLNKGTLQINVSIQAFHSGKAIAGAGDGAAIGIGFMRGSRAGFGEDDGFKF